MSRVIRRSAIKVSARQIRDAEAHARSAMARAIAAGEEPDPAQLSALSGLAFLVSELDAEEALRVSELDAEDAA
jgi:hypothetical protein